MFCCSRESIPAEMVRSLDVSGFRPIFAADNAKLFAPKRTPVFGEIVFREQFVALAGAFVLRWRPFAP